MATLFVRKRTWHAAWYEHGKQMRASLHTDNRKVAEKRLSALVKKSAVGWTPQDDLLLFEGMIDKVRQRQLNKGMDCADLEQRMGHLQPFFMGRRAVDISTDDIERYKAYRRKEGAAPATMN